MQKSFKGAWGQISPTSEKWLQATLLAECEANRICTAASSKVGTALPCLPVRFRFCKGTPIFNRGRARQNTIKDRILRFRATGESKKQVTDTDGNMRILSSMNATCQKISLLHSSNLLIPSEHRLSQKDYLH